MRIAKALGSLALVAGLLVAGCSGAGPGTLASAAQWNPRAYGSESTIELGTVRPDGSTHWFKVWIVVIDDQAYVRLGSRSAAKIAENRSAPHVGVRVAGQQFDRVRAEPAPEMIERVAQAMAAKYWSDVVVHLIAHPLTLRLRPE
jgi:hypothetical protein